MCDYRSRWRSYPCEQGWVRCDRCKGVGTLPFHDPDFPGGATDRSRNCPDCGTRGELRCPRCNQESGGGGGGGGVIGGALALVVLIVIAWWGWHAVTTVRRNGNASPSPLTDHPAPPAEPAGRSDQQYKLIINGVEAIGHGSGSWVSCDDTMYRVPRDATTVAAANGSSDYAPGIGSASAVVTNTDPPEVVNVDLHAYPNQHWSWNRGQQAGDAAVTRSGNTYRVSGSIAPASGSADASPVPFEFEATCS